MKTHFDLFHLPQRFAIDLAALDSAYHEVQNQTHPDKFANAGSAEKRVAMQWATRANEAYQTLKNPLARAKYLCELNGIDLQTESNTAMPPAFLMQQMEWREALDDARAAKDVGALENLEAELKSARTAEIAQLTQQLDASDFVQASQGVRRMMFIEKFEEDVAHVFDLVT
ncbi:MAG: Fe-S protein assembly co-chaperone HscB [Proteobacteria bacterium]|nr:Fe-S protein assembly co-chaperone HscB [Pseudomonadota bacterium]